MPMTREEVIAAVRRGDDLSNADLSNADLTGADLRRAQLNGAILNRANLSGAVLPWAVLRGADLSDATFHRADMFHADFTRAKMPGVNLTESSLNRATLANADLTRAVLCRASLVRANLSDANLTAADLTGANLDHADLFGAVLTSARLDDVIGVATASQESALWARIRTIILAERGVLNMQDWHADYGWTAALPSTDAEAEAVACGTAHCLAGWAQALSRDPSTRNDTPTAQVGSKLLPRHAYLFGESDAFVLNLLRAEQAALTQPAPPALQ